MSRFISNLFGTIAESAGAIPVPKNIDFIPVDRKGNTIQIKGDGASWFGLRSKEMQLNAYKSCSPLAAVIDRLAEADINGIPEILRAAGKGKEDYATSEYAMRMNNLFSRPNPLQSWEQFRGQQVVYKKIFGFCPVWPILPAGYSDPSEAYQIWNLPPWLFEPSEPKTWLRQRDISSMITEWKLNILGEQVMIPADKIFILEDSFIQSEESNYILPESRLIGLDMAISNICYSMEADNVLLRKKGPLGAWTHDAGAVKDSVAGYLPMTPTEKEEIQKDLSRYGVSWNQYQYIVSRQAIKWQPVSFDVKQLGTSETLVKGTKEICHRFNYSYTLLEESESTFASNGNRAHLALYQNNIIPNRMKDDNKYAMFFKMKENNCKLVSDYTKLPVMQLAELDAANAMNAKTNALLNQYKNNIITLNMMLTALGKETVPDGDQYYNSTDEYKSQYIPSITQ